MNDFLISGESLNSYVREHIRRRRPSARLLIALCASIWILIAASAPGVSRYAFVAMSFLCALYLFWRSELQYVSFVWWLYFLTPCIRRAVDYRVGFDETSLMLTAPLLAGAISCFELLRLRRLDLRSLPFLLLTLSATYGLVVSLISGTSIVIVTRYFLEWLSPAAFGYLLYARWPCYSEFRDSLQNTFRWGLLVMGVYGVVQYLYAPMWDRFWMENVSEKISSFGTPEPMGIRVFSTMTAPQSFALALVLGLLITFYGHSSLLQKAAWIAGYAGLLLSLARSAWLEWAIAFLALAFLGRSRKILSSVAASIFCLAALSLVTANLPVSRSVTERLQSLNDADKDTSGQERVAGSESVLASSLSSPLGEGWGIEYENGNAIPMHDSAAVELILCTGWIGFLLFYGALVFGIFEMLKYNGCSEDRFISIAVALLLALFVETFFNSVVGGSNQLGLMTIMGLGLAATRNLDWRLSEFRAAA